jgi:hypothetical protein
MESPGCINDGKVKVPGQRGLDCIVSDCTWVAVWLRPAMTGRFTDRPKSAKLVTAAAQVSATPGSPAFPVLEIVCQAAMLVVFLSHSRRRSDDGWFLVSS